MQNSRCCCSPLPRLPCHLVREGRRRIGQEESVDGAGTDVLTSQQTMTISLLERSYLIIAPITTSKHSAGFRPCSPGIIRSSFLSSSYSRTPGLLQHPARFVGRGGKGWGSSVVRLLLSRLGGGEFLLGSVGGKRGRAFWIMSASAPGR